MLEIAAIETMTDIHFVRIITMRGIGVIGKNAKNVGRILKLKCMCGMELTSIILRNLRILLSISRQSAQSAKELSDWVKMDIVCLRGSICVKNVEVLNYEKKEKWQVNII
ncbi:MAG: hypothetical protein QMC80_00585 [Thermoplasmatales archaeon]|nr:hypothetical protein [Thermoplasmatales archaeon]